MHRLIVIALVIAVPSLANAQGDLVRVRRSFDNPSIRSTPASNSTNDPNRDNSNSWWQNSGAGSGELFIAGVMAAGLLTTAPLWGPHYLIDEGYTSPALFPPYPYACEKSAGLAASNQCADCGDAWDYWGNASNLKPWILKLSLEDGNDFISLNRLHGQLFLDSTGGTTIGNTKYESLLRFGFLANWNYFSESLANGNTDEAIMSDYNLTYRFAQSPWLQMHIGLGARLWRANDTTHGGINALYRAEAFPIRPIHLVSLFEIGNIGDALVLHGRMELGANFRHGELFVGYDFLRISRTNLQGPMVGLRFWF